MVQSQAGSTSSVVLYHANRTQAACSSPLPTPKRHHNLADVSRGGPKAAPHGHAKSKGWWRSSNHLILPPLPAPSARKRYDTTKSHPVTLKNEHLFCDTEHVGVRRKKRQKSN